MSPAGLKRVGLSRLVANFHGRLLNENPQISSSDSEDGKPSFKEKKNVEIEMEIKFAIKALLEFGSSNCMSC